MPHRKHMKFISLPIFGKPLALGDHLGHHLDIRSPADPGFIYESGLVLSLNHSRYLVPILVTRS